MQNAKAGPSAPSYRLNKSIVIAGFLVILAVLGIYGFITLRGGQTAPLQPKLVPITQSKLEEDYGLRVQLVAVTAAGGLVDVRMQIVDAEKVKAFLDDSTNFPTLHVGNDVVLQASEDVAKQGIQYENGKSIFLLYPNAQNVVKPGDPVTIVFGDLQVEAIKAQ